MNDDGGRNFPRLAIGSLILGSRLADATMAAYIVVRFIRVIGVVGGLEVSEKFSGGEDPMTLTLGMMIWVDSDKSMDGSLVQDWRQYEGFIVMRT